MNNFETKAKIVASGNSRIFKAWQEALPNLTKEMFLKELDWLCNDPLDELGKLTREIGLTSYGIVRLERHYNRGSQLTTIRYQDGRLWDGDNFYRPCSNKNFADKNGMIWEHHKISLSAKDRV